MSSGFDGSIRIDTRIDSKGFNSGLNGLMGALGKFAAAVGVAFGVAQIFAFGKAAVDVAAQMGDALVGLQSILNAQGRSFSDAQRFIESYTKDGLIPATNAIGAYKNLASRGYSTEEVEKLMTVMKDAAAFNRQSYFSMGEAVERSSQGLRNENSLLTDSVGIQKNVARMWDDYAKSIGKSATELTIAEKRQAEVNGFVAEAAYFMGDAGRATQTYSGKVAALGASFINLKVAIGNSIIPILAAIIPYVKMVIDWLTALFSVFAQIMAALFGYQASVGAAQAQTDGLGTSAGGVADATEAAADGAGALADNTKKAGKAAKGALAAFDELNVLQQETEGGAGSGGGGVDVPVGGLPAVKMPVEPVIQVPPEVLEKVEAFKQKLLELFGPAIAAFGRLREALAGLGGTIWDGLKWAWDNILVPLGEWAIHDALPVFLDLLAGAARVLDEALKALAPMGKWLFDNFLKPVAEWTGDAFLTALQWLVDRLNDLADWIKNNQTAFQNIVIVIASFAAAWWLVNAAITVWTAIAGIAAAVTAGFGAAVAFLTSPIFLIALAIGALIAIVILLIKNWDWVQEKGTQAWEWIKKAWAQAGEWLNKNVVQPIAKFFSTVWADIAEWAEDAWAGIEEAWEAAGDWFEDEVIEPISDFFSEMWDNIKKWAEDAWNNVKLAWNTAAAWFNDQVVEPIKRFFNDLWDGVKRAARDAWETIKAVWSGAVTWLRANVIDPIRNAFDQLWTNIGEGLEGLRTKFWTVFDGIRQVIRGVINSIIGLINTMLSAIVTGLNAVIGGLNSISINIPSWVPVFGNKTWSFNIAKVPPIQIPMLATGAVVPAHSNLLAMLGEGSQTEIVTPEDKMREIVSEVLEGMMGAEQVIDMRVELDGETLYRGQQRVSRRRGMNLITAKGAA